MGKIVVKVGMKKGNVRVLDTGGHDLEVKEFTGEKVE